MNRAVIPFFASVVVLVICLALLHSDPGLGPTDVSKPRLVVLCAAGLKGPVERLAAAFEADTGIRVTLELGGSQSLFAHLADPHRRADVFLPADESYVRIARANGLVGEGVPLARMHAVVIALKPATPPDWATLVSGRHRVAQADPAVAAIGKLTKDGLPPANWQALDKATTVYKPTVADVLNAVRLGAVDSGIVWDAIVVPHLDLAAAVPPELAGVTARVEAAVAVRGASPAAAERFVRYLADPTRGGAAFRAAGYDVR